MISKVLPLGSARAAASVPINVPAPAVLDDHRQSLRLVHLLRQQARDDIDRAPGGKPAETFTALVAEGTVELQTTGAGRGHFSIFP